jgi:hypothetical protein
LKHIPKTFKQGFFSNREILPKFACLQTNVRIFSRYYSFIQNQTFGLSTWYGTPHAHLVTGLTGKGECKPPRWNKDETKK